MSKLVIRADGSPSIGMGHIRRCMSLSGALSTIGINPVFTVQKSCIAASKIVKNAGMPVRVIPSTDNESGCFLPFSDADDTIRIANDIGARMVLVDNYMASSSYLDYIADSGLKVAVIDDTAERRLTSVSFLVNQNLGAEKLRYVLKHDYTCLLGPQYALLRPQFNKEKRVPFKRLFKDDDNNLLITLGGGDTVSFLINLIDILEKYPSTLNIRCIADGIGEVCKGLNEIKKTKHRVELYTNVADMASLMTWADVSINAGGSTCWELCCMGVPMLIIVFSKDQGLIASELDEAGCARNIGLWHTLSANYLIENLSDLLMNPQARTVMSLKSSSFVDGNGAERVASALGNFLQ